MSGLCFVHAGVGDSEETVQGDVDGRATEKGGREIHYDSHVHACHVFHTQWMKFKMKQVPSV